MGANDKVEATFYNGPQKSKVNDGRFKEALNPPKTNGGIIKALINPQPSDQMLEEMKDHQQVFSVTQRMNVPDTPQGIAFVMGYLDEIGCEYRQEWHQDDPGFDLVVDSVEFALAEEKYYGGDDDK